MRIHAHRIINIHLVFILGEFACPDFVPHDDDKTAIIIDAMSLIQALTGKWKTFGEVSDSVFSIIIKLAHRWKATRVDFVSDRYYATSIKDCERGRRAANAGVQKIHIYDGEQRVPKQWKKFLNCGENKESLVEFLCQYWRRYPSSSFGALTHLYATSKEKCYLFSPVSDESHGEPADCTEVLELESNHEEADTRLLLHSKHASESNDKIIVKSPDTDVFVLCVAMQSAIQKDMLFMTGTGSNFRVIPIKQIVDSLDDSLRQGLLGFHAFSGIELLIVYMRMF